MGNISSYGTRTSSAPTDRLFIATSSSDTIQSATAGQVVAGSLDAGLDSIIGTSTGLLPYRGASAWDGLSIGTAGQVLTVGESGVPTWADSTGGGGGTVSLSPYTRPALSSFSTFGLVNTGATFATAEPFGANGPITIMTKANGATSRALCGVSQPISSAEWMLTTKIRAVQVNAGSNYYSVGIGMINASDQCTAFNHYLDPGQVEIDLFSSFSAFHSTLLSIGSTTMPQLPCDEWIRIYRDPVTPLWEVLTSIDGIVWSSFSFWSSGQEAISAPFDETAAVCYVNPSGASGEIAVALYHWELASGTGTSGGTLSLNKYAPATLTFDPSVT